jgi:hypothetical protein
VVKDGKDDNQTILIIEATGSLTAHEVVMAAVNRLENKMREFNDLLQANPITTKA